MVSKSLRINGGRRTARFTFKDVRRGSGAKRAKKVLLPESFKASNSVHHSAYREDEASASVGSSL